MHKLFKTLHGTITIDPVVLTENKKNYQQEKMEIKVHKRGAVAKHADTRNWRLFLVARMSTNSIVITVFDFR